ncbi:MAG TPA: hypothetical protein VIL74_08320 [Pyrinomonadaceae bacterium]|jgi:hypothetical protein
MFTHRAKIQLKPNTFTELSQKIHDQIMPALRLQKGFCAGVTSIDTIWLTAIGDTSWETEEDAKNYQRDGYPQTLKILRGLIGSEPATSIFEVSDSKIQASRKPLLNYRDEKLENEFSPNRRFSERGGGH